MKYFFEIYLTKPFITKEEWEDFIRIISKYQGYFQKWKLYIKIKNNEIHYYVRTKVKLPATLNGLSHFLLKEVLPINITFSFFKRPYFTSIGSNLIEIVDELFIKKEISSCLFEVTFRKLREDIIKHKICFQTILNNKKRFYHFILGIPSSFLEVDFSLNKRFFYQKAPKYLELTKSMHLFKNETYNALFKIDMFPYFSENFYLNLTDYNFYKHSFILGSSGSGKSKFLSLLVEQIIKNPHLKNQYRIVIIDPHASLEDDIGGLGKVIDFKDNSIHLFHQEVDDPQVSTELLLELFLSLNLNQYNSKLERVLRYSLYLLLTNHSFNLSNLKKIILDLDYRNDIIRKQKENLPFAVINFFLSDFNELKTKSYAEAISPIISFIDEMEMIPAFLKDENETFCTTIENNFLTLFSLDKLKLGEKVVKTISGLVMEQLITLAQSDKIKEHIIFIVDEVAIIENPLLTKMLSEARKYHLSVMMAGQYFNQISENLKASILANVVNYYLFRVSREDAQSLAMNMNMKLSNEDSLEEKINMLANLKARECIMRIENNDTLIPAFKGRTSDLISYPKKNCKVEKKQSSTFENKNISFQIDSNISLKDVLINRKD